MLTIETATRIQADGITRVGTLTPGQLVDRLAILLSPERWPTETVRLARDTFRALPVDVRVSDECADLRRAAARV